MQTINPNKLVLNKNNPRFIKDDKFAKLVQSIKDFPEMLDKRPIVVDEAMIVLGGNMRLRACREAGLKTVPYVVAEGWTEEQKQEFIIKDNVGFGSWDWNILLNEWNTDELEDWGLELQGVGIDEQDYSEKNKEIDIDSFDDEMVIKLKYTESEYNQVKGQLSKIAQTPEQAVWKLLGNE